MLQPDRAASRQRFLTAGLGGIAPILLSLIVIDLETILLKVTPLAVTAYLIRVIALFAVGGLVGWLHKTEKNPVKLFQLGIAAPALITAAINGSRIPLPEKQAIAQASSSWSLIANAHAQTAVEPEIHRFSLPQETPSQQVYRGLFGAMPKNVWYVVAGSHPTTAAAEQQAIILRQKGFAAKVYAPYGSNPFYTVVIGSQITLEDARRLRSKAINAGLPKETYLWTFPER
jgi:hypothetical protein